MKKHVPILAVTLILSVVIFAASVMHPVGSQPVSEEKASRPSTLEQDAMQMIKEGRQTFRFDTFGDEEFWGDALKLHHAIIGKKLGGVGDGVSPKTALVVGLKVDMDALPKELVQQIKEKKVDLDNPATTVALLKLDAVVGVKGFMDKSDKVRSVGIACAICHSTVDDAFAPASAIGSTAGPTVT